MALPMVNPEQDPGVVSSRALRKRRTSAALRDAALDLFVSKGFESATVEEIATRAGVSPATVFRYFDSKGDVIVNDPEEWLPVLGRAIVDRPGEEDDLAAIRAAVTDVWARQTDPTVAAKQAAAIATSPLLRGLSYEVGLRWRAVISDSLARRRRLAVADDDCVLTAEVATTVVGHAVDRWLSTDPPGDLAAAIDVGFSQVARLSTGWVRTASDAKAGPA